MEVPPVDELNWTRENKARLPIERKSPHHAEGEETA